MFKKKRQRKNLIGGTFDKKKIYALKMLDILILLKFLKIN